MKYLITTSLLTSIIIVIAIPNLLNSILLLTAGGVSLYWSLSYFITMQKETNLLKEENLYFIDSSKHTYSYYSDSYLFANDMQQALP